MPQFDPIGTFGGYLGAEKWIGNVNGDGNVNSKGSIKFILYASPQIIMKWVPKCTKIEFSFDILIKFHCKIANSISTISTVD